MQEVQQLTSLLEKLEINPIGLFLIKIIFLVFLALLVSLGIKLFFKHLFKLMEYRKAYWAEMVLRALYAPLLGEVWFLIILSAIRISLNLLNPSSFWFLNYAFELGILLGCVWFCVRMLGRICDRWMLKYHQSKDNVGELTLDPTSILVIRRVGFILITAVTVLIVLGVLKIPLSGLLTFGGIFGAALAFASQSVIANFFGGLFIYFDRPFLIGDWISSPEKNLEGVVEHIGWRLTLIRSLDKRPLYVPNSIFTSTIIVNPSRMTHRRINQNITVCYPDAKKLPSIMEKIRELLKNTPEIDQSCSNSVSLLAQDALNSSGISFNISAYSLITDSQKFKALQDQILLQAEEIITAAEAKVSVLTH